MTLLEKLKKLEQAIEGDALGYFEIDRALGLDIGGWSWVSSDHPIVLQYNSTSFLQDADGNVFPNTPGAIYDDCYSESLEAASRLCEYALPGWTWSMNSTGLVSVAEPAPADSCADHHHFTANLGPDEIPLALCLAIVRGKIWQLKKEEPKPKVKTPQELLEAIAAAAEACGGQEQSEFEIWASRNNYNMHEHPFHYLFLDPKTYSAREGWNAALAYIRDVLKS